MPHKLTDEEIVERLLRCFYLYNRYAVGSRDPAGLLMDVIQDLRPDIHKVIQDEDADVAYQRFFVEDGD